MSSENLAKFVREQILRNPSVSLEQLQAKWAEAGFPKKDEPSDTQVIHSTRYNLKQKYGLKDINDLPIKANGELNVSQLIRLLFKKHSTSLSEAQCLHYLALDGIKVSPSLYIGIKKELTQSTPVTKVKKEPIQDSKPRARLVRKGRQTGSVNKPKVDRALAERYMTVEKDLDEAFIKAKEFMDSDIVEQIRKLRRTIIYKALSIAGMDD